MYGSIPDLVKLVFESQPYRNNWAGQYEGTNLPEGSYYYRIDLDGNGYFEGLAVFNAIVQ